MNQQMMMQSEPILLSGDDNTVQNMFRDIEEYETMVSQQEKVQQPYAQGYRYQQQTPRPQALPRTETSLFQTVYLLWARLHYTLAGRESSISKVTATITYIFLLLLFFGVLIVGAVMFANGWDLTGATAQVLVIGGMALIVAAGMGLWFTLMEWIKAMNR